MRTTTLPVWFLFVALSLGTQNPLGAAPLTPQDVPELLRPWLEWVLHGHEEQRCPFLYNNGDQYRCRWPSRLELQLHKKGGEFSQQWFVLTEDWVPLPGDPRFWPQDVRLDNQPALLSERNGTPSVYVQSGNHTLSGHFVWDTLPPALQVPGNTGLIALTIQNQTVTFPILDSNGKLWLQQQAGGESGESEEEDRLELKVYRRIIDEIPLLITTRIDLQVSGRQREILLGPALIEGFIPMSLESPLPARLEPDGRLRIQVRPGRWNIELTARHPGGSVSALTRPSTTGPWVEEEVWVFDARPHLRLVSLAGVPAIEPQQTTLPVEWQSLPAYRLRPGDTLQMTEKKRGDPDPAPDQLVLERRLWLDFTGGGYTIQDHITGVMTRGWRLDLNPPAQLGRVTVDGQEQFITTNDASGRAGVEVRRGHLELLAESRLDEQTARLPAVGWDHDFQRVSGELHLPLGWRLFAALGVDQVPHTWLQQWTLLDLFLVLVIALSVSRLWGRPWGGVALLTLLLIYHESDAPRWIWLHILAATALLRVLPVGRVKYAIHLYRALSLFALAVIALPFMVEQARQGLYPQLEKPWQVMGETSKVMSRAYTGREADDRIMGRRALRSAPPTASTELPQPASPEAQYDRSLPEKSEELKQYDPNATIQTGPGLPRWQWTIISLQWSGPVERNQQMRFVLIPPWLNRLLAFVRVILLVALVLCILNIRYSRKEGFNFPSLMTSQFTAAALPLFFFLTPVASPAQGEIPSNELLNELRARLLEKPPCLPQCATSPRLRLEVTEQTLRARLEVHSSANVAVPLPGQAGHWLPQRVFLNGEPARGLFREASGQLWIELPIGQHQVTLEGSLPDRDTVQLSLSLKPHRVEVQATGWIVDGIHEDGVADDQLQLQRLRDDTQQRSAPPLEAGTLPPFVQVERMLRLALTWQVDTRVVRVSPRGSAAVLEVPLLPGESVTSDNIRVEAGKALLSLGPQDAEVRWSSTFTQRTQLPLTAPDTTAWTEIWRLDVSPIWHVEATGIPIIHHSDQTGRWLPEWRPWPGETLTLHISRPAGVPGQTLTMESSQLVVTLGQRATDVSLHLRVRSSRGGQQSVTLPDDARLQSASINGQAQPIRQEGRTVTLPLTPGTQAIELLWQQTQGTTWYLLSPVIDLGMESVNAQVQIVMPYDRWILFCGGPRAGPAVLFWPLILVIVLVSIGLGRLRLTPLQTWHWILLGIGLSPVSIEIALFVVGWVLALGLRRRLSADTSAGVFNAVQIVLAAWTLFALLLLFYAIQQGLLGLPDMQIAGNGSTNEALHWYQDRSGALLPQAWVLSAPMIVYRLAMLAWSLWLAFVLLRWLRWGWECFSENGLWRRLRPRIEVAPTEGSN